MGMSLIDKDYKDQLAYLHQAGKFNNGHKAYAIVKDFIEKYQPTGVLDFGCGQGGLIATIKELHPDIEVTGYDPGNPNFQHLPEHPIDTVVSTDALEHIEPDYLDATLRTINEKMQRCGFFRIACYPAKKSLPDGRNAHLIVESPEWWRNKIQSIMDVDIVWENIQVVDKTSKWPNVKGHNYDVVVVKRQVK
jgi:cyclopropane fatty-acyl-phospholipid synthase-like methyltransferase